MSIGKKNKTKKKKKLISKDWRRLVYYFVATVELSNGTTIRRGLYAHSKSEAKNFTLDRYSDVYNITVSKEFPILNEKRKKGKVPRFVKR